MKDKVLFSAAVAFVLFALPSAGFAESWYLGLKGGPMISDINGMDSAGNLGLTIGWPFWDSPYGGLAAEGEVTTTISKGQVTVAEFFSGKWDVTTAGLFLAYRSPHALYAKGKAGVEYIDLTVSRSGNDFTDSDFSVSGALGAGWRISERYSLEVEYAYKTDLEVANRSGSLFFLSLGLNCHF